MKRSGRRRISWAAGHIFLLPQIDGTCSVAQVLDPMLEGVAASCAFYDIRAACDTNELPRALPSERVVTALSVTSDELELGKWRILGTLPVALPRSKWPNEEFRSSLWVGALVYSGAVVEGVLNFHYGLAEPDRWSDLLWR